MDYKRQTYNFIQEDISNSPNAPFLKFSITELYQFLGIKQSEISLDTFVTMIRGPVLPMTFNIMDKTGEKVLTFTLLVNPNHFNHGKTTSASIEYTREGYISQIWGPGQDLLTATGTSAAFMVAGKGLTATERRRSFGFLNFMALLNVYRNNGYILSDPTLEKGLTRVISIVNGIELLYDNQIYLGHFNNFTIDDTMENPYFFNYNFEFIISSLSGSYNEIRGHFLPLKPINEHKDIIKKNVDINMNDIFEIRSS